MLRRRYLDVVASGLDAVQTENRQVRRRGRLYLGARWVQVQTELHGCFLCFLKRLISAENVQCPLEIAFDLLLSLSGTWVG